MAGSAKVESLEALARFRASLCKFADEARTSLDSADSEVRRAVAWVQTEQRAFWQRQVHNCADQVTQAAAALRHKKIIPTATGSQRDTADEEKALRLAKARLEHAEQKVQQVKRWGLQLPRDVLLFAGQVRGLSQAADTDIPRAVGALDRMTVSLEKYLAAQTGSALSRGGDAASVARASEDEKIASASDEVHKQDVDTSDGSGDALSRKRPSEGDDQ